MTAASANSTGAGPLEALGSRCPLCTSPATSPLWQNAELRVVAADDSPIPGFTRVVWTTHVREMSDLDPGARSRLIETVWQVEKTLRACLQPQKVNVASLGNQVPHLHWHIIPRWPDDPWFPDPVWSAATPERLAGAAWASRRERLSARLDAYHSGLAAALQGLRRSS